MGEQTKTSPDAIEAEIAATRAHLAETIDELSFRDKPKEIVRRKVESAKAGFVQATHTPEGGLRLERVAALGTGSVVLLGLVLAMLHRRHHGRRG